MAHFENWAKTIGVFQRFKSFLNFYRGRPVITLSFKTLEIWLKKDEGFDSRDVSSICMTKHLNLARIQAFSKRAICICLGLTDCNRWIFHLRWEAADPGIRGEENWGWVGRRVEIWAAGACSCEVPGHRDNREHGGNAGNGQSGEGRQQERWPWDGALGSGIGAAASGPGTQTWQEGAEPGQPGQEVGGFCWVRRNILSLQVLGNDHSFAARKDLGEQGVIFVVSKVKLTHTYEMAADQGVCGSPGAVSQGCHCPRREG